MFSRSQASQWYGLEFDILESLIQESLIQSDTEGYDWCIHQHLNGTKSVVIHGRRWYYPIGRLDLMK